MTVALMDALEAFSHLQDNIPAWINRVSELATHTSAKHAEYSETYWRYVSFKSRRRRNNSVCFIHTGDLVPAAQREGTIPDAVQVGTTTTRDTTVQAQYSGRKRGMDEAPFVDSSERHSAVSTRHNVIIGYDGHTQKVLEEVARDISIARHNIRQGKVSMMLRTGLRVALLDKTAKLNGHQPGGTDQSRLRAPACVRSTRSWSKIWKEPPFDFADRQLGLAHRLCETAAYQVLRSGDCGTELDGVEEKFTVVLEIVRNEIGRLTEEMEQHQATEQAKPPIPTAARPARVATITASNPSTTATSASDEVDDVSFISTHSINLSALRPSQI